MGHSDRPGGNNHEISDASPLDLTQRYLHELLASPNLRRVRDNFVPLRLVAKSNETPGQAFVDLAEALKSYGRLVILGDVGGGKTSLLKSVTSDLATHFSEAAAAPASAVSCFDEERVPLYIRLQPSSELSLEEQARQGLSDVVGFEPGAREMKDFFQRQKLLILFDEFSRVAPQHQLETLNALVRFIVHEHPEQSYVIALRAQEFSMLEAWFKDLPVLSIKPLDDPEITSLVSHRLDDSRRNVLLKRLMADSDWWEMARNPLLLNAACAVVVDQELSDEQDVVFLERLVRELISGSRNADCLDVEASANDALCWSSLADIALAMMRGGVSSLDRSEYERLIENGDIDVAQSDSADAPLASPDKDEVNRRLIDSGLLTLSGDARAIGFREPLFKQFFGAMAMERARAKGLKLRDLATGFGYDTDRERALIFYVSLLADKRSIIAELIGDGSSFKDVLLAAKCLVRIGEGGYRELVAINSSNVYLHQQFGRAFRYLKYYSLARQAFEDAVKLEPNRASAHQELADVLVELGDLDGAEKEYNKAYQLSANEIEYRFGISSIDIKRRDLTEASEQLKIANEALAGMQAEMHHRQGHLLEAEGRLDDAMQEYEKAIRLTDGGHFWFHIGALHRRFGKVLEAEEALQEAISRRFDDADAHLEMGTLLEERDELAEALQEYRVAAHLERNAEVHSALGRAYRKLGRLAQAEAELQRAIELNPAMAEAIAELGLVYEKRCEYQLALERYRQALRIRPDVPQYYRSAGWLLRILNRLSEAETELGIAVKLDPSNAEYREQLGAILADSGRCREALKHFQVAASLCPMDPTFRHQIGVMHSRLGNHDAAVSALTEAIELCSMGLNGNEQLPPSMACIAAEAHGELGLLYEKLEQWQQAMSHYQSAADLMPLAKGYRLRLGTLYRRLGQLDKAVETLRHAASLDPEDAEISMALGAAREAAGDLTAALDDYKTALELDSSQAHCVVSTAKIYRRLGQPSEAGQVIAAALERGLESAELRREMAAVCIAVGEGDAALVQSRKAIKLEADNPLSHIMLARSLLLVGQLEQSLQELKTAVALDSNVAEAHYYLAQIHEQRERLDEARANAVRAVMLAPDDARYAYLVGHLCAKSGRIGEAIEYLKRAVEDSGAPMQWHAELASLYDASGRLDEAFAEHLKTAEMDESPAPHLFLAGKALFSLGRCPEAAEMLLRAIQVDSSMARAYALLGQVLLEMRQPEAAMDRFLKAVELEPKEADHLAGLSYAYLAQDRLERAAEALEKALAINPDRASWHNDLGRVFESLGKWNHAVEKFEKAVSLDPREAAYLHDLATGHSRIGNYQVACKLLTEAVSVRSIDRWHQELGDILAILNDLNGAVVEYQTAISLNPTDWRYQRKIGLLYLELEQAENAAGAFEAAFDLYASDNVDLTTHYGLALAYGEVRRFSDASKELALVVKTAPGCLAGRAAISSVHRRSLTGIGPAVLDRKEYGLAQEALSQALNLDPNYAPAYAELGSWDELNGGNAGALEKYLKAADLDQRNTLYKCSAAQVCLNAGKWEEAEALTRDGLAKVGEDAPLVNQLGLIYEARQMYPKALDAFERAISLDPRKALYRFNAGRIRLRLGKQVEGQRDMAEAVQMNPHKIEWRKQLALLYEECGKRELAAAEFRSVLELEPNDFDGLLGIGRVLTHVGRSNEALAYLEQSAKLNPSAAAFDQLGVALRQLGQFQHALRYSQQALKREPKNYAYQLNLALTMKALGQIEKAGDEIKRIASEAPNLVLARYHLGALYEEQGDVQKALSEYLSAVEMAPDEIPYSMAAARAHRLFGRIDDALAIMRRIAKAAPGDPEVFAELARIQQARSNFELAARYYRKAIAVHDQPVFHHDQAILLSKMGRPNDAIVEMRVAITAEPRNPKWHIGLGQLFEEQGKLDEAIALYRKALTIDPKNAESHRSLGIALKKQGKFDEAIQELQQALDINPKDNDAYKHLTAASASQLLKKNLRKDG